jgi:hypothetical protein
LTWHLLEIISGKMLIVKIIYKPATGMLLEDLYIQLIGILPDMYHPFASLLSLKVLSDENQGGSKLVSIDRSCFTV